MTIVDVTRQPPDPRRPPSIVEFLIAATVAAVPAAGIAWMLSATPLLAAGVCGIVWYALLFDARRRFAW